MKIGLCLMVWNELRGCELDVPRLPLECFDEVFALDGGSTDGSVEYLKQRGIPVVPQSRPGYNRAYIAAFEHTACDALVIFHPKGSVDPASLRETIPFFRGGADLVIASRNAHDSRNEEDGQFFKPRKWFVLALSALCALLWRRGSDPATWDVLHGYRGMRRDSFFAIDPLPEGLSMDLQMVVRSYRLRLRQVEFPVQETPRLEGATHFKAWPTGKKLLAYLLFELKRPRPTPMPARALAESAGKARR